jgi:periplasmic protein TonB
MSRKSALTAVCLCISLAVHLCVLFSAVARVSVPAKPDRAVFDLRMVAVVAGPVTPVTENRRAEMARVEVKEAPPAQPIQLPAETIVSAPQDRASGSDLPASIVGDAGASPPPLPVPLSGGATGSDAAGGGEQVQPPAPTEKPGLFLPVFRVDKPPEFIRQAPLVYPVRARELGIEGTVFLEALIDAHGALVDVTVSKGLGYGMDEEALRMIRGSSFAPASANGKSVGVKMLFRIKFSLR